MARNFAGGWGVIEPWKIITSHRKGNCRPATDRLTVSLWSIPAGNGFVVYLPALYTRPTYAPFTYDPQRMRSTVLKAGQPSPRDPPASCIVR